MSETPSLFIGVSLFCPQCRTEYRQGFTQCADCQVPLVSVLPDDAEKPPFPDEEFVEILETSSISDISTIKSVLSGYDIPHVFMGEGLPQVAGISGMISDPTRQSRLMVRKKDVEDVKEFLKDLKLDFSL